MALPLIEQSTALQSQAEAFKQTAQYRLWELGQLALSSREWQLVQVLRLPSQVIGLVEV